MSKILYGAGAVKYRGAIRGTTFQLSQYGEQAENRNWGTVRKTPGQGRIRSAFRYVVSMWRNLTKEERESWQKSAKTAGGAFQAFVSYNIKHVSKGEPLTRTDGTSLQNVTFTPIFHINDIKFDNTQANLVVRWSANVNLDAAGFNFQTLISFANAYGAAPSRENAVPITPDLQGVQGQVLEQVFNTDPIPGTLWQFPGLQLALYLTPLDPVSGQPAGSETEYVFPETGNFDIKYITAGVTVSQPGGQPQLTFQVYAPARQPPADFIFVINGYKMTDPAEIYDPTKNSILGTYTPVRNPPLYNYSGDLDPTGPPRQANPGDRYALQFIIQRTNPFAYLSAPFLAIPTVTLS